MMQEAASWLVWLTVGHFAGDWLFQPHAMALAKSSDPDVRIRHCFWWTFWTYAPVSTAAIVVSGLSPQWGAFEYLACWAWLLATHYWIDSYKPLYWYRKHVSKDPEAESIERFKAAFASPRGFVVYVTLDQVFHLLTLIPVAFWLAWRTP